MRSRAIFLLTRQSNFSSNIFWSPNVFICTMYKTIFPKHLLLPWPISIDTTRCSDRALFVMTAGVGSPETFFYHLLIPWHNSTSICSHVSTVFCLPDPFLLTRHGAVTARVGNDDGSPDGRQDMPSACGHLTSSPCRPTPPIHEESIHRFSNLRITDYNVTHILSLDYRRFI